MLLNKKTNFLIRLVQVLTLLVISSIVIFPVWADDIDSPKEILASATKESPKLDGYLNEDAWKVSRVIDQFFQREPYEGAVATERTEVRIITDDSNLYIGIICFDSDPGSIIAKEMERDSELGRDDNFSIILDTFNDKRSAFYFAINPNGAKFDAQIGAGGRRGMNKDWDGVWDVRTRITDNGWSAEIVIPFKTLRFKEQDKQTWGVNFRREIARKNEETLWQGWRRNEGIFQLGSAGELQMPTKIKQGRNFIVLSYLSSGYEKGFSPYDFETGGTGKIGFDAKYALSPTLTSDFTLNTDFAQVEADQERINLTRYSLFFPEKRAIFFSKMLPILPWAVASGPWLFTAVESALVKTESRFQYLPADELPVKLEIAILDFFPFERVILMKPQAHCTMWLVSRKIYSNNPTSA